MNMNTFKKLTLTSGLSLVLAACASTYTEQQQYSSAQTELEQATPIKTKRQQIKEELSPNITFPPAIDITYADVSGKVDQHIGTNVRWGGQVIESTQIDDLTIRMTVFGYPLANNGRPVKKEKANENYGRFIVELKDGSAKNVDFKSRFVTLYGDITSQLAITNGDLQKTIPVVNAEELVDWNRVDQIRTYAKRLRGSIYDNQAFVYHGSFHGKGRIGFSHRHSSFGRSSFGRGSFGRSYFRSYRRH